MSIRYKGGILSATPPTLVAGAGASGAWTLEQQMQATAAGNWPVNGPFYIEDVFSTYLYTGNGSTQTITNNIDLSTKGGLVWIKCRNSASDHSLEDTLRTVSIYAATINSNTTLAQSAGDITGFTTSGFSLRNYTGTTNANEDKYVSWTLRKQPKFFDVVTWTGNDAANRQISHSLGSVPGCIIVKRTDASATWRVWHQNMVSNPANLYQYQLNLNTADAVSLTYGEVWGTSNNVTSTTFQVGSLAAVNASGGTYVAYLFAHNAGGFGLTGSDNVISCGSFNANNGEVINLGYEPQWLLYKDTNPNDNWRIADNMRGLTNLPGTNAYTIKQLMPNLTNAESDNSGPVLTSTGFTWNQSGGGNTHIYIAIRRGPMKVPTSGTSVFSAITNSDAYTAVQTTGFRVDAQIEAYRPGTTINSLFVDRLRGISTTSTGGGKYLISSSTNAETSASYNTTLAWNNTGFQTPEVYNGSSAVYWSLQRAPGFFDEVCYTGVFTAQTINHNLTVAPEMIITKKRSSTSSWPVYHIGVPSPQVNQPNLNETGGYYANNWYPGAPTSTTFTVQYQDNGSTYVAYLFATCAGVSKVGSYTGTGALQTVNCGFTGGARFVLIKRTDSTGDWYVWDSARGITSGNDPYLLLNSAAAEVTGTNYVDTTSVGFQVTAAAPAGLNANGGTYIFLAIA